MAIKIMINVQLVFIFVVTKQKYEINSYWGSYMKHYRNLIILLISILVIVAVYCFFANSNKLHKPINVNDVESINIIGRTTSRIANKEETQNIVKWFNSITNIRENKDLSGTTAEAVIIIKLKTGNEISISKSGKDFEVQRTNNSGELISYWGKQSNIRDILYSN